MSHELWVPFNFFLATSFSADFTLRSNSLISSSAGNCSGFIPLFAKRFRTSLLFLTCSPIILFSPFKSCLFTLKLVISVASCLADIVMVGKKSAKGRFSAIPYLRFMALVLLSPNNAQSPLLRILAKPLLSTPLW
jgi:hypothetical protein